MIGIEKGDEVITTPATCFCAQCPALQDGANLVWADVQRDSMNIDPSCIEDRITGKTKAIYVVFWGGYPADMSEICEIATRHGLPVIVDGAHAIGSSYHGQKFGECAFSRFEVFSFQAIKQMTCGDGGALMCSNEADFKRAKLLRWYGIDRDGLRTEVRCEDDIKEWGFKYHMNDINSIIGLVNMAYVEENNAIARDNVKYYRSELAGVAGINLIQTREDRISGNWLFSILAKDRLALESKLRNAGIGCNRVHARNDVNTCVKESRCELPNVDFMYKRLLCIPAGWWVTPEDREYIVSQIKGGW
jgi:dTDP-4-amino-4,6-dideoxygalactose transaminase